MRIILPFLCILCFLGVDSAWAAGALVGAGNAASASPANISYTVVGTNNLLVACGFIPNSGGGESITVSDTKSNTWTAVSALITANSDDFRCYYAIANGTGADTVSCTAGFGDVIHCVLAEFSGNQTSSVFDTQANASGTSTALNSGSFTTTATDILVGCGCDGSTTPGSLSVGSGWSSATNTTRCLLEYKVGQAAGSYTATETDSASRQWIMQGMAFKEAGSAAPTARRRIVILH